MRSLIKSTTDCINQLNHRLAGDRTPKSIVLDVRKKSFVNLIKMPRFFIVVLSTYLNEKLRVVSQRSFVGEKHVCF